VKITFAALNYAPSTGGAQELVRRVAEGLVAHGHEVEVLTTDALRNPGAREPGRIVETDEEIRGVRVRRYRVPSPVVAALRLVRRAVVAVSVRMHRGPVRTSPWLFGPWSPGLLRAIWNANRTSDVVVACSAPFTTMLAPLWLRRGARARLVVLPLLHVSEADAHNAVRRSLAHADLVVTLTEFEAGVAESMGVDPARVSVIPAGTDPDDFPDLTPVQARTAAGLPQRPTVGFIGRLAAYKGIDTLLEAAEILWRDRPDTTVLIGGNPAGWEGHKAPEVTAVAGDRLVVREGFADDERAVLLAACDVIAHPSREESFGMVVVEAWAARRPIVVADIPAVRDFVEPGRTGELIAPGDSVGLARALAALLDDPHRRELEGQAGRARAIEQFSWGPISDAWHAALVGVREGAR
jgi:glycosyltransferase involved in cell wall biosynthesis